MPTGFSDIPHVIHEGRTLKGALSKRPWKLYVLGRPIASFDNEQSAEAAKEKWYSK